MSEEIEIPPSVQEIIFGQPDTVFVEQPGPGITEEFINTLNKSNFPDRSSGELIPIGEDMAATLIACRENGTWPDWLGWFNREKQADRPAEVVTGKIAAAIDRAKWGQTVHNVLLEIHCRSRGVLVIQKEKNWQQAVDSGEVLPLFEGLPPLGAANA